MSDKRPAEAGTGHCAGLSITEASAAVGLSKITVLRRVSSGAWPGGKTGRKWLVSQPFINALVAAITTSPQVNMEDFAATWMAKRPAAPANAGEVA